MLQGVFFLYFAGRLHSTQTQLELAVDAFHKAIKAQREYVQLGHICYWSAIYIRVARRREADATVTQGSRLGVCRRASGI